MIIIPRERKAGFMKRIVGWLLVLGLGWLAYILVHEDTARYRITYTVETPSGEKSGAHVVEIWRGIGGGVVGRYSYGLRGEAAVIDLGGGKSIIALLAMGPNGDNVDGPQWLPSNIYAEELRRLCSGRSASEACDVRDFAARNFPARELKPPFMPTIVTFTDLNDPKTARVITPEDYGYLFGPGYAFRRATLEMVPAGIWPLNLIGITGEPVTRGIEKRVPFLVTQREPLRRVIRDMPPRFQTGFSQFTRE